LSDIRAAAGRLRGLPLAVFAALACPLALLAGVTLAVPTFTMTDEQPGALLRVLALAIPAGVLTFCLWAIFATARWGGNQPVAPQRRGVLKWIFLGLLAGGLAVVLSNQPRKSPVPPPPPNPIVSGSPAVAQPASDPLLQLTFTAVALRQDAGHRWLVFEVQEQSRGECQRTLRWSAPVPDFTAETRTTTFGSDTRAGFAPVQFQRIEWKLPAQAAAADLDALRLRLEKQWVQRILVLNPGEEKELFGMDIPGGGHYAGWIGAILINNPR
jgi:hypothetical protein